MDHESRLTMSVPEYGASRFGLAKNAAYQAAHAGQIPTIQIGARLYVPVKVADKKFGFADQHEAA